MTVLLIDDEPEMSELVGQWLDQLGASVVRVGGFEDALAVAGGTRPRVVLLDIALGDEDGLEMLPRLRASRTSPAGPHASMPFTRPGWP